jgi:1,4-dihydroxy-2-naphthoate octaprenyltransferase
MTGFVKNTVAKRLEGDRPSTLRAILASIVIGIGAAVLAYKVIRMRP